MPYPSRLSQVQIVAEGRALLEEDGRQGLTMRALARRLGVSAPSLYFHVESRDDLLVQLIAEGLTELGRRMAEAGPPGTPSEQAHRLAGVYVAFAEASPQLFTLIFGPCAERSLDWAIGERASAPILQLASDIVGPDRALALAGGLWSLVHGYTVLKLAAQFRLDPDPESSFAFALDTLLEGAALAGRAPAR